MTEREFFNELAKLDGFYLTSSGQIRCDLTLDKRLYTICPILALANHKSKSIKFIYSIDDWIPAATFLGLSKASSTKITEAEDNANDQDINIRKKLLKACKLEEKAVTKGDNNVD